MINFLTCCLHHDCIQKIELDENIVWITGIICLAIFLSVLFCLLFLYKKSNKRIDLEKEKRQLEEKLSKKANELQEEQKKNKELDPELFDKEKKKKEFLDYCYKMAKSLDKGNEKQREDCWRIILHNNLDYIPDEMKKEYNIAKKTDSK